MILEPPAMYDHSYVGPAVVESIEAAPNVDWLCRNAGATANGQIIGCAFKLGRYCFIILARHAAAVLRRHEIAHCNGWRHD